MNPVQLIQALARAEMVYADDSQLVIDGQQYTLAAPDPQVTVLPPSEGWVALRFRRPPNDDTPIYAWNTRVQQPIVTRGIILNTQFDQMQSREFRQKVEADPIVTYSGYFATHWRPAHGGPTE